MQKKTPLGRSVTLTILHELHPSYRNFKSGFPLIQQFLETFPPPSLCYHQIPATLFPLNVFTHKHTHGTNKLTHTHMSSKIIYVSSTSPPHLVPILLFAPTSPLPLFTLILILFWIKTAFSLSLSRLLSFFLHCVLLS